MSDAVQTPPPGPAAPGAAAAAKPAQPKAPDISGGKSLLWIAGGLAIVLMLAVGLGSPTLLAFMVIGFAPTVAAAMIDTDNEKHGAIAVGAMSLGGMIPMVLGQLTARAGSGYTVLGDPFAWLLVYGAAAVGWGIHSATPAVSIMLSNFRAEWRRDELKKLQEQLTEEWGQEVVSKKKQASS